MFSSLLTLHSANLWAQLFPAQRPTQTELSIYDESVDESTAEYKNLEEVSLVPGVTATMDRRQKSELLIGID